MKTLRHTVFLAFALYLGSPPLNAEDSRLQAPKDLNGLSLIHI